MTMELPNLNDPQDLFAFVADVTTRPGARSEISALLDHTAEGLVLGGNEAQVMCRRCEKPFTVRQETDDFGNKSIVGGVRIRGRWTCTSCEYDALVDEIFDCEATGLNPVYDVVPADWFLLTDSQVQEQQRSELVDAGLYDELRTEAPDVQSEGPELLGMNDLVWNEDAARDGGDFL